MRNVVFTLLFVVGLGLAWISWGIASLIPAQWWQKR